MLLSNYLHTMQ